MVDDIKSVSRIKDIHSGGAKLLQLEVGRVLTAIQEERDRMAALQAQITAAEQDVSIASLTTRASRIEFNEKRIQACQTRIAELQQQHSQLQSQWHAAERQVEAMGTLLTTRRAAARRDQMRKEIIEADEIVGRTNRGNSEIGS